VAAIRVSTRTDNVAGVKLPVFTEYETGQEIHENLGLAGGGRQISNCREKFREFLVLLIRLASLQTSFITLDEALKVSMSCCSKLTMLARLICFLDMLCR
jgi:V-type H+-transporting ATPase subunit D